MERKEKKKKKKKKCKRGEIIRDETLLEKKKVCTSYPFQSRYFEEARKIVGRKHSASIIQRSIYLVQNFAGKVEPTENLNRAILYHSFRREP